MERDEKNEANERDEAVERDEASERAETAERAEASKKADKDIEIFESLGLSDELKLVCEYIAENLSMSYFRGKPELHAMDAVREIMKDFLEVLKGCYAGYDGIPGKTHRSFITLAASYHKICYKASVFYTEINFSPAA